MATTSTTPRDKFLELRKSWVDAQTARKQAYGDIIPPVWTPATPSTPPVQNPPVVPPQQTTPPQTVTWVNGEKFPIAPIDPQTGLSQPTQTPTSTQPVPPPQQTTPEPVKTETTPTQPTTTVDKTAEIKAKNEAQMALNKQSAEQKQAERDKAQMEANNQLANNEWAILNTLKTGGIIPEQVKTSPYYKSAQNTYNKLQQFSTYSTVDLTTALNSGSLLPWTSVYNEMLKDPVMKQKLVEAQSYTIGNPVDTASVYNSISNEILSNNPSTAQALKDWVITPDEYAQLTNTPDIVAKAKDVEEKTNRYNELQAEYDQIEQDVKSQFPWSPFADSIIADRQKAKYKNLFLAKWQVDSAVWTLTELKSQSANLFETNLKLYQDRLNEQNKIAAEQRQMKNSLALSQMEFDQKLQQNAKLASDPTTAIGNILKQFSDIWVIPDRDVAWHVAEQRRLGMTLPEYTQKIIADFKKKPEYQAIVAANMRKLAPEPTKREESDWQIVTIDWKSYERNKYTGATREITLASTTPVKPTGNIVPVTVWNKTVRLDQSGAKGFENAVNQLTVAWISIVVWQGHRDQVETIQSMANQYWITFNANNPAETAAKLRAAGHQVANPWKSNHETGMAIDVYSNDKLEPVTTEQEKILNANGWYSAGIPWDAWHFEYRWAWAWTTWTTWDISAIWQFLKDNQERWPWYSTEDVKAFNEKVDRYVKAWDIKWLGLSFRNNVMQNKAFQTDFDNTTKFNSALDTVSKMIDEYEKAWKSTNALNWMAEKVARKLGITTDTALAQLQTQMWFTLANYIKSISGTAASDAEVTRLMGNMANISNVKDLNTAIISQVRENWMNTLKSLIDTRMYWLPEDLKYAAFEDVYGKNPKEALNEIKKKIGISSWSDFTTQLANALK